MVSVVRAIHPIFPDPVPDWPLNTCQIYGLTLLLIFMTVHVLTQIGMGSCAERGIEGGDLRRLEMSQSFGIMARCLS